MPGASAASFSCLSTVSRSSSFSVSGRMLTSGMNSWVVSTCGARVASQHGTSLNARVLDMCGWFVVGVPQPQTTSVNEFLWLTNTVRVHKAEDRTMRV